MYTKVKDILKDSKRSTDINHEHIVDKVIDIYTRICCLVISTKFPLLNIVLVFENLQTSSLLKDQYYPKFRKYDKVVCFECLSDPQPSSHCRYWMRLIRRLFQIKLKFDCCDK
jgi:hypothetical protein